MKAKFPSGNRWGNEVAPRRGWIGQKLVRQTRSARVRSGIVREERTNVPCHGFFFSKLDGRVQRAFMLLSSLEATRSRAGRPRCTFHPWIEKLSRFDLNCATLISVFRVVVVSAANLYPRARFKIRNSNGNTISRGSYKEKSNIFLLPDIVHAPVMANVISALYDNTRFHILLCPISLFSPMSAVQRPERCVQRRYIVTGGVDRHRASLHAIAGTKSLCRCCARFRQVLDPLKLEFSGALTRKHVGTCCMCSIPLTYIRAVYGGRTREHRYT